MRLKDIDRHKEEIVQNIVIAIDPNHEQRSETYMEKEKRDIRYTLLFTIEAIKNLNEALILNYYRWLIDTLSAYDIDKDILFNMHKAITIELFPYLSAEEHHFLKSIDIKKSLQINDPFALDKNHTIHKSYLNALLDKDRAKAVAIVEKHLSDGMDLKTLYMDVIQMAMYEIGYLWQRKKITVAEEHLATVITQFVITTLYPKIFSTHKNNKKVLGAGVGSELHEIGIRMVIDFFEIDGYQTQYLGSNTPPREIVNYAISFQPDIIALSITLPIHIDEMKKTISFIRSEKRLDDVKILVGGQPFIYDDSLYLQIGADGYAKNALDALKEAQRFEKQFT